MRYTFNATPADVAVQPPAANTSLLLIAAPGLTGTLWNAETGGTQYTDLLVDGVAADHVTTDASGRRAGVLQGPDGVPVMFLDYSGGTGPRYAIYGSEAIQIVASNGGSILLDADGVPYFIL